ncbi:MAG TPA: Gfo/Idh/MocA family oxidoreductase, partial [Bryobacteraceae bacterium]|nr:Gfo/Idh/MocA family oxidoreductase [Bryobacteraceae bacterium]
MGRFNRRSFMKTAGPVSLMPALPHSLFAQAAGAAGPRVIEEVVPPASDASLKPKYSIKFAVIGIDHNHILGITAAMQRGGGQLVSVLSMNPQYPKTLADFKARFGDVKIARSEDEILNDPEIKLVCAAPIPDQRAALGIRVMKHGKDYLVDKPGIITLAELAEVRKTIKETGRIYGILFSERLEVKAAVQAGVLVKAGAIGKVVQTINIAPHQVNAPSRPDWFWDPARYGGILCDIGSHQVDQFLFYTGSTTADVTASQVANVHYPQHPKFQDFGDVMLHGNGGAGYVRVDWFTPNGVGVWGDGRLFILGTDGYIELRKYADIGGRKGGNHLFLVDNKAQRHIDCTNVV